MSKSHLQVAVVVILAASGCASAATFSPNDADEVLRHQALTAPNPGEPGRFVSRHLYYGSGEDRQRPEFRDSVAIKTKSVDASKLVSLGNQADDRNKYWGFSPKEFPVNGRVWYPEGPGPFPLVLIVHGNHNPRDFSDPGYGYLGELLASRGYIFTSVDMNFINGTRQENDGRGWMLLKHLQAWKEFNETSDNPFFGKVDLNNIALMGHSRGGEAVGHAAAFNRLTRYPDDADLKFDFNFSIKSIIAIAPVDGQYSPTGRFVPVENVNYMVFHGSHDGDVTSFHGLRQYHRVQFTDNNDWFKTAIYMYRANHGQWNTVWGSHDNGPRSGRTLNLSTLIDPEDQRTFAKIYVSAFLDATLKGKNQYLSMFRDHRVIGQWLPKTMYVTRFEDASFEPLATYEEDIDVTSGTADGVSLNGEHLSTWREDRLVLRSRNQTTTSASQENQAVWLGWNNTVAGRSDSVPPPATYTVGLSTGLASRLSLQREHTLDLMLAAMDNAPGPRRVERDSTQERGGERPARDTTAAVSEEEDEDEEKDEPIDLTVRVVDASGASASVALSAYGPIRKPLEITILRRADQEQSRFADNYDLMLQSYSIQLADFVAANPSIDVRRLREVALVFDRASKGTVVVDGIGFSKLRPGFTEARIR